MSDPQLPTHRHLESGDLYAVIGEGRMQARSWRRPTGPESSPWRNFGEVDMAEVVIYQSMADGSIWVRPLAEFNERFERLNLRS